MLRPSRPMIRPFMSSDGSSTSETVVSAAWLAATRWSASATRLRARRFDSVAGLLLELADAPGELVADEVLRALERGAASPRRRSSPRSARARRARAPVACFSSSWSCLRWSLAVGHALLAPRELDELRLDLRPRARARAPRASARLRAPLRHLLLDLRAQLDAPARGPRSAPRGGRASAWRSASRRAWPGAGARRCDARAAPAAQDEDAAATAPTTSPTSDSDDDEHGCSCLSPGAGGIPEIGRRAASSGSEQARRHTLSSVWYSLLRTALVVVVSVSSASRLRSRKSAFCAGS